MFCIEYRQRGTSPEIGRKPRTGKEANYIAGPQDSMADLECCHLHRGGTRHARDFRRCAVEKEISGVLLGESRSGSHRQALCKSPDAGLLRLRFCIGNRGQLAWLSNVSIPQMAESLVAASVHFSQRKWAWLLLAGTLTECDSRLITTVSNRQHDGRFSIREFLVNLVPS